MTEQTVQYVPDILDPDFADNLSRLEATIRENEGRQRTRLEALTEELGDALATGNQKVVSQVQAQMDVARRILNDIPTQLEALRRTRRKVEAKKVDDERATKEATLEALRADFAERYPAFLGSLGVFLAESEALVALANRVDNLDSELTGSSSSSLGSSFPKEAVRTLERWHYNRTRGS